MRASFARHAKLVVVESEPIFRHALAGVLREWGFVAAVFGDWDELESAGLRGSPAAALLDLASEPAPERRALHRLVLDRFPRIRTIILSESSTELMATYAADGASIVLPRRAVDAGQLRRALALTVPGPGANSLLSRRQLRLLSYAALGYDDVTIATALEVRARAVAVSLGAMSKKLRCRSRAQLVVLARACGLGRAPV